MRLMAIRPDARNETYARLFAVGLFLLLSSVPAHGQYALTWSSTPAGGGRSTGGSYALISAVGNYTGLDDSSTAQSPDPDPMQWATAPYATSSSAITMMAAQAQDPNGGVQYYFQNITFGDGSHDSGWQDDRTYTDTGLEPDAAYEYKVKARGYMRVETEYSIALPVRTEPEPNDVPEGSAEPVSGELGNDLNLQVDPFTGSVSYTLSIAVPPGRQGSEPSLALRYGGGGNGWCGFGWSLGMGAIQRDTRRGVPVARDGATFLNKYDDEKGFVVAFGAVNSRLVLVDPNTNEYRAETDQAFLKYEYDATHDPSGLWTVTDKSGNRFYFGQVAGEGRTAGAVMTHPQFSSATTGDETFLWALAKIQDINGNLTYVYYTQDANQLYLDEVRYNGHTYGPLPTTSSVKFVLDPNERTDKSISYATGYRVETNRRLTEIGVYVYDYNEPAWARVRSYHLEYEQSPSTLRSLLTSVKMCGTGDPNNPNSYLPPVTFEYQQKPFEFDTTTDWGPLDSQSQSDVMNSPVYTSAVMWQDLHNLPGGQYQFVPIYQDNTLIALMDLNGDGLPDRVQGNLAGYAPPNNLLKVQFNTGTGFTLLQNWGPIDAQGQITGSQAHMWNSPRGTRDDVYIGWDYFGSEWIPDQGWVDHWEYRYTTTEDVAVDMVDINGDGLADRIMRQAGYLGYYNFTPPNNVFKVQFNTGIGFSTVTNWGPLYARGYTIGDRWYDNRARVYNSISAICPSDYPVTILFLADMNHDGLPDRVLSGNTDGFTVQFNTGNGFENDGGTPVTVLWGPVSGQGSTEYMWVSARVIDPSENTMVDVLDINGDGLPDRVMRKRLAPFDCFVVQFNTGYGFEKNPAGDPVLMNWGPVSGQGDTGSTWRSIQGVVRDTGTLFVDFFDINGDGLPDRVMRERTTNQSGDPSKYDVFRVQLNTGNGFQKNGADAVLVDWTGVDDQGVGTAPDWASPHGVRHPYHVTSDTYVTMCDVNGDGLPDRMMRKKNSPYDTFKVQLNKGPFPDLLSKVTGELGGFVQVTYESSVDPNKHKDADGVNRLPFPVQVATLVRTDDGFGNRMLRQYGYARGFYNAARKEFSGFGLTTVKDVNEGPSGLSVIGTTTTIYFHQGGGYEDPDSGEWQDAGSVGKSGMHYRVELYGNDGQLYSITTNKVEEVEVVPGTGWHFAYVAQTTTLDCDAIEYSPGSNEYPSYPWSWHRAKAKAWEYDTTTGNLLTSCDLGEVTLGLLGGDVAANLAGHTYLDVTSEDDVYVHNEYAVLENLAILDKISMSKTTSDANGVDRLAQTFYTYDPNGRVLTEVLWLDRDRDGLLDPNDANTAPLQYAYDEYGNQYSSIDRVGIETITTYDPNYHIFAIEKTTGSFVTSTEYDIRSGLPARTMDPAGMVTENIYDAFFRLTDVMTSAEPNGPAVLWQTHIDYSLGGIIDQASYNYVHQMHEGYEACTYSDGIGRIVQTRVRAETGAPHEYRVTATTYNELGKVSFQTLPFFSDGSAFASTAGQPGTLTEYDAMGRLWKVTPPAGETGSPTGFTITEYAPGPAGNPWHQAFMDAEGKTREKLFDATGRLVQAAEFMAGTGCVYTDYVYDRLGRLIQTIDNANNVFEAEYDSLGRKIRSLDPDMGEWTYLYDDAGRMLEQEDARGNRIQFSYNDEQGRVTQKRVYDDSAQLAETINYIYDQSDDPEYTVHKGQTYKVTDGQGWTKTGYDSRGRAIKATRYLSETGKSYTTQTAYDSADRVTQITYPGNKAVIAHTHDSAGHLVKVESLWGTGTNEVFYQASQFNEDDQAALVSFGNGVSTQMQFYAAPRRLKRTYTSTITSTIQDITYTYDKVSNIKSVSDAAHAGVQSCSLSNVQYDDLHRLVSLYSSAEGRTITYEYTPIGNIYKNGEVGIGTYAYAGSGHAHAQPHAVTSANGNTYAYDVCGNMVARNRIGHANQTLTYDAQNRLVRVLMSDGNDVTFGYSAGGARLWKKVNGEITGLWIGSLYEEKDGKTLFHVYAGGRLVATFEPESGLACFLGDHPCLAALWNFGDGILIGLFGGGRTPVTVMWAAALTGIALGIRYNRRRLKTHYGLDSYYGLRCVGGTDPWRQMVLLTLAASVFLSSNPQAAYADSPQYDPVFYYYHPDHLGSSQLMTDRAGAIVQHYGYTPFGKENYRNNTYAFSLSNRYTGQQLDEETGLYYYGARYYDPELARFIQADPVTPSSASRISQAYNRYAYCHNNPLKLTDPTGNVPVAAWSMMWVAMMGAMMGAIQAGWVGDNMLAGAFNGAVSAVNNAFFTTETNSSTALTSLLTGNAGTSEGSTPFAGSPTSDPSGYSVPETNKYKDKDLKPMLKEAAHMALDAIGVVEPVPVADTINAAWYASEGRVWEATSSSLGMVSYLGDTVKAGRYGARTLDYSDTVRKGLPGGSMHGAGGHGVNPYQVGRWKDLHGISLRGDDLALHHVGQAHVMEQMVPGYRRIDGPSIALPTPEHLRIPAMRGPHQGSARSLLANDILNLRNYTGAPNSSLKELIELNKQMYPGAFKK